MVLGDPVAVVAEAVGETREVERVAQRLRAVEPSATGDWSRIESRSGSLIGGVQGKKERSIFR